MTARRSRVRLFAGCALFALAIGAAIVPSLALAQEAGRGPAPVRQAVVETTSAAPSGPTATQQAQTVTLPPVAQKFFAVVRVNFAQWDLNHDGRLTREEIELDMQDARIKGEAAAALAALKIGATKFDKLDETRDFTIADIDEMERTLRAGQKLDANFIGYFNVGQRKLEETPRELFAQGQPHLTAMRQYFTSDCYFLSAVGAVAETNPTTLVKLITTEGAGTYVVRFPGQPAVRVASPTDAEIATYTAAKDGVWLSVLQKAYALVRIRMEPKEAKTRQPLDSVGFRLGSTSVMELLTGNQSRAIRLGAESDKGATGPMVTQLRSTLTVALRERRAVTASMNHHAYAITGYDPAADLVTIHNPYNSAGYETLPEGNKVRRSDQGFFTISTAQFASSFYYLRVQQGGRAKS